MNWERIHSIHMTWLQDNQYAHENKQYSRSHRDFHINKTGTSCILKFNCWIIDKKVKRRVNYVGFEPSPHHDPCYPQLASSVGWRAICLLKACANIIKFITLQPPKLTLSSFKGLQTNISNVMFQLFQKIKK